MKFVVILLFIPTGCTREESIKESVGFHFPDGNGKNVVTEGDLSTSCSYEIIKQDKLGTVLKDFHCVIKDKSSTNQYQHPYLTIQDSGISILGGVETNGNPGYSDILIVGEKGGITIVRKYVLTRR